MLPSIALLALSALSTGSAEHLTIPVTRTNHQVEPHLAQALAVRNADSPHFVAAPESHAGNFWYGSFDIGECGNSCLAKAPC